MRCGGRVLSPALAVITAVLLLADVTAGAQALDEVIAKNLAGRGGIDKLRGLETVKFTGVMEARGMELPIATWAKRPNKLRREQKFADRTITVAFDGATVWSLDTTNPAGAQAITGPQAESTRDEATFDPLLMTYKERGHAIELVGTSKLDGVAVHHLRVTRKSGQVENLYLSADTGLEYRTVITVERDGVKAEMRTDFGDYRVVDGLRVPFSMRQFLNGNPMVDVRLTKVEFNVPVDDAIFTLSK